MEAESEVEVWGPTVVVCGPLVFAPLVFAPWVWV